MKNPKTFLLVYVAILIGSSLLAQDFDGDSIYYSPIPKTYGSKVKKTKLDRTAFKDTLFTDRKISNPAKQIYFISVQTGSLIGCASCYSGMEVTSTFSFVNGVTIGKKFRAGIGVGLDFYDGWKTVPAFASIGWDMFGNKNRNAFFLQLNYGMAKAWKQNNFQGNGFQRAEGDRMISPQVGYRIKYHDLRLALAVGVKLQRVFSFYEYPSSSWRDGLYEPTANTSTMKQDMNRIMVTMAVGWK